MHDQIELYHIINSKPILPKNAHYQLRRHFLLHSVVFKAGGFYLSGEYRRSTWGGHTPAVSDSDQTPAVDSGV